MTGRHPAAGTGPRRGRGRFGVGAALAGLSAVLVLSGCSTSEGMEERAEQKVEEALEEERRAEERRRSEEEDLRRSRDEHRDRLDEGP